MAQITQQQCDRNESKRSYLSKRRPVSPSRIKLKYLAKQQQQQQETLNHNNNNNNSSSNLYYRHSSQPSTYDGSSGSRMGSAKSMEWHVRERESSQSRESDLVNDQYNRHSQPNEKRLFDRRTTEGGGSISKAKSIDFLSTAPYESTNYRRSVDDVEDELGGAMGALMISNQKKFSGSSFTVFGDGVGSAAQLANYYDDGDSGILVNESGQCSMLSDQQPQQRDEIKTIYLRRSQHTPMKNFGLLISQIARSFETDHNRFRIRHVLRNSEADLSGQVVVGDEIISVNDVPAIELNFDQIQEMINAKTVLSLVLQRGRRGEIR